VQWHRKSFIRAFRDAGDIARGYVAKSKRLLKPNRLDCSRAFRIGLDERRSMGILEWKYQRKTNRAPAE
jgi:hypothetical protein